MGKLEVKVQKKNLWLIIAMTILLITLLYFNLNKGGKDIPLKHYNEIKTMRIHTNNVNIKTLDDKNEIQKILDNMTTLKEIKSLERHKNKEISMEIYTEGYKFETLVMGEDYLIFKGKYYGGKRIGKLREEMEKYVITQDNIKEILKNLNCDIFAEDINYFKSTSDKDYFKELFNGNTLEIREYDESLKDNWKFPRYKIVTNLDLNSSDDFDSDSNSLVSDNSYMT
ncbi:hypothetical protein, partial [Clostridium sp.]|uniref:hypothetical protein n=1 Tax=Clostridium sp. TaxID=1506 RepID=UPI003463AD74